MFSFNVLKDISSPFEFETLALEIYHFQKTHCKVYGDYVRLLNRPAAKSLNEIPFLPIQFFKSSAICCGEKRDSDVLFLSSGTENSERSQHYVRDIEIYKASFRTTFRQFFGDIESYVLLALLPNYIEQGSSSLVYMVDTLIKDSKNDLSGFLLNEKEEIEIRYKKAGASGKKVIVFGVSYALLDLAEKQIDLQSAIVVETGGMKGRRAELSKNELHAILMQQLNLPFIYSEYGMTELLSQAYSKENGVFVCPPWMKVIFREIYDPLTLVEGNRKGAINVIDLANSNSCSFIATQDMGRAVEGGFLLEGRIEQADLRGCNLLID